MARSQKIWVREPNFPLTAVGATTGAAAVRSLRDRANVLTAGGVAQPGLPQEFTVVRFMAWWQYQVIDTNAATVIGNLPACIGARVAGTEEIEELAANTPYREENGPLQDPETDWMFWHPCYAGMGGFSSVANTEVVTGMGHIDIRSARRVDSLRDDFAVYLQLPVNGVANINQSLQVSYAALVVVH